MQPEVEFCTEDEEGIRACCGNPSDGQHKDSCPVIVKLDASYKQDGERAIDSYTNHAATALVKRARLAKPFNPSTDYYREYGFSL